MTMSEEGMSTPDTEIIDLAVNIELECAALYEVYARCFASQDELVYFWRLYAEAERYHAASIRIHQASLMLADTEPDTGAPESLSLIHI